MNVSYGISVCNALAGTLERDSLVITDSAPERHLFEETVKLKELLYEL